MVPNQGRFPLISQADSFDVFYLVSLLGELLDCLVDTGMYGLENLFGIMLVPSAQLGLAHCAYIALATNTTDPACGYICSNSSWWSATT